jgi:hypothetical protein
MAKRETPIPTVLDNDAEKKEFRVMYYAELFFMLLLSVAIGFVADQMTAWLIHHHVIRYLGLLWFFGGFAFWGAAKAGDLSHAPTHTPPHRK